MWRKLSSSGPRFAHLSTNTRCWGAALGVASVGFQAAGVQCAAEGVSRAAKVSETRMQRQWVRACVRVGAASDVVERRKVVRSVEVRMASVLWPGKMGCE